MTTRKSKGHSDRFVQLPFMCDAAIYTRGETAQVPQPDPVETLRAYAHELGYADEQITVYADRGERATAPLQERKGYTSLLRAISQGRGSVVFLHAQGHIFNGADELQVNTFIHLCMEKGILIITPQAIYDMANLAHIVKFRAALTSAFSNMEKIVTKTAGGD